MPPSFTLDDIVLYLYDEMEAPIAEGFRQELNKNPDLQRQYQSMLEVHHRMDREWRHPSQSSVDIIMGYSNSISSLKTH